jgi:hypothetical protein
MQISEEQIREDRTLGLPISNDPELELATDISV